MEVMNCPRCGRLFTKIRSPICESCEKMEEETFQSLKDHIEENPHCTMAELSTATGVSIKRITQYIRDGRLEISKGMHGDIRCDQCGKPILRGRYCDKCALSIHHSVNDMFNLNKKDTARMHTNRD